MPAEAPAEDSEGSAATPQELRQQHQRRVVEATRAVIAGDPTLGMKSVFAAVRGRMDPADAPTAKEVRRALAEVKPKAPKPVPRARAAPSAANAADEDPRADYTGCRADPAALSAGGAAPQLELMRAAQSFVAAHRVLLERQAFDIYFIVDSMWDSLVPHEWRATLAAASASQLAGLCLGKVPKAWPPSLHDFVRTAQSLQLDPTPQHSDAAAAAGTAVAAAPHTAAAGDASSWKRHWRGTSPKKREEMERMAAAVVGAASAVCTQNVVDVGSGKGYLSSLLAMEHGLRVLAVEGNGKFTAAAEKRVSRIARRKAERVRPPSDSSGLLLPVEGDASFLMPHDAEEPDQGAMADEEDFGSGRAEPDGPIFVTAMVKAVRHEGENLVAAAAAAPVPTHEKETGEEEGEEGTGEASAALAAKEVRSRSMRQQYTTGAAATAIAAAAAATTTTSTPAANPSAVSDPNSPGATGETGHERQQLKRPRAETTDGTVHSRIDETEKDGNELEDVTGAGGDLSSDAVGASQRQDDAGDNGGGSEQVDSGGSGGAEEQSVDIESLLDDAGLCGGAVLVGLHTCGDLSADSCRLFLRTPRRLSAMVLCGCCYGRLTEPASFPLSTIGRAQLQLQLGYTLRDLATHRVYGIGAEPHVWAERVLFTASYRAALEAYIRSSPSCADGKLLPPKAIQHCTVKKNVALKPSFGAWATAALAEATATATGGSAASSSGGSSGGTAAELQAYYDRVMASPVGATTPSDAAAAAAATAVTTVGSGPHCLMALEALAACVWPVVEALVVLDRLAFLQEHDGVEASLQPLFDPVASPRNWVLVATRRVAAAAEAAAAADREGV
jgi:hypothetical protein